MTDKKTILDLTAEEAREYFLKSENFFSLPLPSYINFDEVLQSVNKQVTGDRSSYGKREGNQNPRMYDINHTILTNKDGKSAWRRHQIIHPIAYVSLVQYITGRWDVIIERFKEFEGSKISCSSIPAVPSLPKRSTKSEQITNWWEEIEQQSIKLSMEYDYVIQTDIANCYSSVYTHSIAWAIHGKTEAKNHRNDLSLIGNIIDRCIQDMNYGQTNGIPEGSILMDFIAEMVLGYADLELAEKIRKEKITSSDYKILRYRDDYRIFYNNPIIGEKLLQFISEVIFDVGFRINSGKTKSCSDIVHVSVKPDKNSWIWKKQKDKSLQKSLLIIHEHARQFPNSGSVVRALSKYAERLERLDNMENIKDKDVLIAIVTDIAYHNPITYPIYASIISTLMESMEDEKREQIISNIFRKFSKVPYNGHLHIWLQRIAAPMDFSFKYQEAICKIVEKKRVFIWSIKWLSNKEKKIMSGQSIIDHNKLEDLKDKRSIVIPHSEVALFPPY